MNKLKIYCATNNAKKFSEIRKLMETDYDLLPMSELGCNDQLIESGISFEDNAWAKADYLYRRYGKKYSTNVLAEYSGLEVDALNDAPGARASLYTADKLLEEMEGTTNRFARFRSVFVAIMNGSKYVCEECVYGQIATEKSGDDGYEYDSVFIPNGYSETFAVLGDDVKSEISHRAKAAKELLRKIEPYNKLFKRGLLDIKYAPGMVITTKYKEDKRENLWMVFPTKNDLAVVAICGNEHGGWYNLDDFLNRESSGITSVRDLVVSENIESGHLLWEKKTLRLTKTDIAEKFGVLRDQIEIVY